MVSRTKRRCVVWCGVVAIGVCVAVVTLYAVYVSRVRSWHALMSSSRTTQELVLRLATATGGFTDGTTARVRSGGRVPSKDGRCVVRVLEVTPARTRVEVSLDDGAPDIVDLPAPGAALESVFLPGGYLARVLDLAGDTAVILVARRPDRI